MTETAIREALWNSVVETLDKMFFISCPGASKAVAARSPEVAAEVSFEGRPPGRLSLRVTESLARTIAADFLGEDERDIDPARVIDVTCEMANMICGAVLSRVESGEQFRLKPPRPPRGGDTAPPRASVTCAVDAGAGVIEAALEMDAIECPAPPEYAY